MHYMLKKTDRYERDIEMIGTYECVVMIYMIDRNTYIRCNLHE